MAPSSRFASCMKPNVAYLVLNFCALWKKQTTLPSLAYAGIPYQSLGERAGALALMIAWSRSPRARSGPGIAAIVASTAASPSALSARGPGRAAAFFAAGFAVFVAFLAAFVSAMETPLKIVGLVARGYRTRSGRLKRDAERPTQQPRELGELRVWETPHAPAVCCSGWVGAHHPTLNRHPLSLRVACRGASRSRPAFPVPGPPGNVRCPRMRRPPIPGR